MKFEMEELVPLVAELAESYTSFDSTSITWEKAEQLMEAVLYCIHELEITKNAEISPELVSDRMSAQQAYRTGLRYVEKKAKAALDLYNETLSDFVCYGNRCLYDTFVKGLPEFFKRYDARYEPQNTILTLDYPLLADLSEYTGVDRIYEYILCIRLEQRFLSRFPEKYVRDILSKYDRFYRDMIENICEIVFTEVIGHILIQKPMTQQHWKEEDCNQLRNVILDKTPEEISLLLDQEVRIFLEKYFGDCGDLYAYLSGIIRGITIRLKVSANEGTLFRFFQG